ncbi:MAG: hypothetical protein ACOWWM_10010 [Desulfobacterales bacterium]
MRKHLETGFRLLNLRLLLSAAVISFAAPSADSAQFFPNGDFEIGNVHLEIARTPRYGGPEIISSAIDSEGRIDGRNSLHLPAGAGSAYRLITYGVMLKGNGEYTASFKLLTPDMCNARVEVFTQRKIVTRIAERTWRYAKGQHKISFRFASGSTGGLHWLRIILEPRNGAWIDSLSLEGPPGSGGTPPPLGISIESESPTGIYRVGEPGRMTARVLSDTEFPVTYQIEALPSGEVLSNRETTVDKNGIAKLQLDTHRPGYFRLEARHGSEMTTRAYAVLAPLPKGQASDPRFGVCMEEHPGKTYIHDAMRPKDLYAMARDIGAGSVRFFSLASPEKLSKDGKQFDFSELDAALAMAEAYGLEAMLPLGSNFPIEAPGWLRTTKASGNVDLIGGGRTQQLKLLAERHGGKRYLDVAAYGTYLEKLMNHTRGKVDHFEIWNEPGHKFSIEDSLKIARAANIARDKAHPGARILGYSSTKGRGSGQGMDPKKDPAFLQAIAERGGLEYVDILSYHSGHAFQFMGSGFDTRNQQTGYVARLKRITQRQGKTEMPIWDTERGIPWKSGMPISSDSVASEDNDVDIARTLPMLDAARQLPMVYASGFADGVERIYWFLLDTSVGQIYKPQMRWVMHDVNGEPAAMIPVYSAMTKMLHGAMFHEALERRDGTRAYIFARGEDTVILAYNWIEKKANLIVQTGAVEGTIHDIYGNRVSSYASGTDLMLDGWPVYVVFKGNPPEMLTVK